MKSSRSLSVLLTLLAALGLLAIACGGGEEDEGVTTAPTGGGSTSTPAGTLKTGSAGISSNPRTVRGLEGWTGLTQSLDDGLAVWKTRPSNETRTGITKDNIKLGQSSIISGPAAQYDACTGPLQQAILKRINEAGGIHGRKIEFIRRDDQFNPVITVQVIKTLVERDQIFATFYSQNTAGHQATRDYLKENKILELVPADNDLPILEPPWPYYTGAGVNASPMADAANADFVKKNFPNAKVGLITTDSAFSRIHRDLFRARAEQNGTQIVADVTVPTAQVDTTSQVQQLVNAGADIMVMSLLPTPGLNAITALRQTLGNKTMKIFGSALPPSQDFYQLFDGNIGVLSFKSSADSPELPLWGNLKKLAEEENARYCVGGTSDYIVFETETLVRALEAAGPDLTREGVMEGMQHAFNGYNCTNCVAPIHLSYVDTVAAESFQFFRWDGAQGKAVFLGEPLSYETTLGKGARGNDPKYPCAVPAEIKALNLPNYPDTLCPWKS